MKKFIKENITSFSPHTSNLSTEGPKYSSGPCVDWDVKPKFTDLSLSLGALSIEELRSGIGNTSSNPRVTGECASCSIFLYENEGEMDNY